MLDLFIDQTINVMPFRQSMTNSKLILSKDLSELISTLCSLAGCVLFAYVTSKEINQMCQDERVRFRDGSKSLYSIAVAITSRAIRINTDV